MKKYALLLLVVGVLSSSVAFAAKDPEFSRKVVFPKKDEIPTTAVFNTNRIWNPEKILFNGAYWECAHYNEDGTCARVQKVKADAHRNPQKVQADAHHKRITEKFIHILQEQWGIDTNTVSGESLFLQEFGADSLDITELIMAIEDYFDIVIGDNEWEAVTTVDTAVELIIDKTDQG